MELQILKRKIPFLGKSIFYSPRGPVVNFHDREQLSILISRIQDLAKKHKAIVLKIDPEIEEDDEITGSNLEDLGFLFNKKQINPGQHFL